MNISQSTGISLSPGLPEVERLIWPVRSGWKHVSSVTRQNTVSYTHLDVYKRQEWIRRRYAEITLEKKEAGGKDFTYDDVKRKVQIRKNSYKRNQKLIKELILELNITMFKNDV